MVTDQVVYTIGHGNLDFDTVAESLVGHGVQTIVDVRSIPHSKHAPDFAKAALEEEAAASGLGYRWMGRSLGGRPDDPALLGPGGSPDLEKIASSPAFEAGLTELEGLARVSTVALLCAELEPDHCHRHSLLAPALVERGFEVRHILRDGSVAPHQSSLGI